MVAAKEWVDFKAVKAAVTMQMVLDRYQIAGLKQSGDELRGACPIHKGMAGSRQFCANLSKNAFQCFFSGCKARGNVLDFVAAMEGCSVRDAALKLAEWFEVGDREVQTIGESPAEVAPAAGGSVAVTICLQGEVLARAGFISGDRFSIECAPGKITLVKVEDSS